MKNIDTIYLFYSEYCDYCIEVLEIIKKFNLDYIHLVCVDREVKLPQVVDRVPLVLTSQNKIIVDDEVISYLTQLHSKSLDSISALVDDQSSSFSFIDEDEEKKEVVNRGFNFIGDATNDSYENSKDLGSMTNIETQNKGKIDQKAIDKYTKERENDYIQMKTMA